MNSTTRGNRTGTQPTPDDTGKIEIARYARSCTPLDLEALDRLGMLTIAAVLAGLADHELERRRRAARQLACHA